MTIFRSSATALLFGSTFCALSAQAQTGQTKDKVPEVDEVVATGRYLANEKFSALKTPTLIVNVPQALSITTEAQIQEQAFRDFGDILRFTPGAAIAQGEGHRDQITLRGQNTTADFFLDGVRDDVQYFRPLYNLEQVEILRGSNAMIFGRGGGGGVINRVTKKPFLGDRFNTLELSADTFGSAAAAIDSNFDLSDTAGLRLNAFAERLDNHRDEYGGERFAINPTLAFSPIDATRIDLSYEYVDDDRVVDRGVPAVGTRPAKGFDNTFFGSPDLNETTLQAHILRGRVDHKINDAVSVNLTAHYADYDKLYQNIYPIGLTQDFATVSLDGYRDTTERQNLIVQGNLVSQFATGGLGHTLLFGLEYGDQDTENARRDAFFEDSQDDQISFAFSDPLNIPAVAFPVATRDRASDVGFLSVYVQDQVKIGDHLQIVAGVRYDDFDIDVIDAIEVADGADDGNNGLLGRSDGEWSPRLGAIYKPQDNVSIYAGYSQSFLPRSGDQFLTLSPSSESLAPEEFRNYEAGVKWDIRPDLALTTAVFQLDRDAGTVVDPANPDNALLVGSRTQGFEAQLIGDLSDRWHINTGYSYLDADERGRISGGVVANRTLPSVPKHMVYAWGRYDVTDRFGAALGVTHQSSLFASISNRTELPAFTRFDAALYYDLTDKITAQLNIENLTGIDYFPSAHNDNNISTGEPTNARLTLRTSF